LPGLASKAAAAEFDASDAHGLRGGGLAERDAALPTLRLQRLATDPASLQAAHSMRRAAARPSSLSQAGAENEHAGAAPLRLGAEGASSALPLPPLATLSTASPAHPGSSVQALPFEARLAAALDSAAFAPALASQVTWLVQEGVQQARLNLNPAEMGPVAVRIVLDGTQARIDFSADIAATRSALEASLPTLAARAARQRTDAGRRRLSSTVRLATARPAPGIRSGPLRTPVPDGNAGEVGPPALPGSALRSARGLVDLVA
jgi:hypothetical protein